MERVFFALFTMGLALTSKSWQLHLLIISVNLLLLLFKADIPPAPLFKILSLPLAFLLIGVFTIAIQVGNETTNFIFHLSLGKYYLGLTPNSLGLAFHTLTLSLSAFTCLCFLALTTPMVEIIYLLHLFKLPEILIEIMVITYRFIFVFLDTAMKIYYAQESRYGHSSFRTSIKSFGLLFANLWGKAFFKAKALFQSLESRSFTSSIKVLYPKYEFCKETIILLVGIDLFLLIILIFTY